MNVEHFFGYWGLEENPFKAEEARDDPVFLRIMGEEISHPDFEKICGSAERPSTAVVFGEKGSGKTAIRLQMEQKFSMHNEKYPDRKVWVVRYDELNPVIDRVVRHAADRDGAATEEGITRFRLADHMDAMLSSIATRLVDLLLDEGAPFAQNKKMKKRLRRMSQQKRLDLAQLVLLYDQPSAGNSMQRWRKVVSLLRVGKLFNLSLSGWCALATGILALAGGVALAWGLSAPWLLLGTAATGTLFALSGYSWASHSLGVRKLRKKLRQEVRATACPADQLYAKLGDLSASALSTQPLPLPGDQDSRYEMTTRLMRILDEIDYTSLIVLIDRVDEPARVNGDPQKMKALIWPLFHNKFLQQDHIGIKLLLPIELGYLLRQEGPAFFQQARLDKQNMIERLEWTGATLYDICSRRVKGCESEAGKVRKLTDIFEEDVKAQDVMDALDQMNQPRDAFKFLYAVIQEHCQNTADEQPNYRIPKLVLEQVRKQQSRRVQDMALGRTPA